MKITFSFEPDEEKQVQAYFQQNYYKCADPTTIWREHLNDCKFGIILENCMVQGIGNDRHFDALDWRSIDRQGIHNNEFDLHVESFKIVD